MKSLIEAVVIAALITAPLAAFAQSNQPVTRAQVRAELVQLEKAGYNPATANDSTYPADIQAAESRVQAQNPQVAQAPVADTGYGPSTNGSSQASVAKASPSNTPRSVYFGN